VERKLSLPERNMNISGFNIIIHRDRHTHTEKFGLFIIRNFTVGKSFISLRRPHKKSLFSSQKICANNFQPQSVCLHIHKLLPMCGCLYVCICHVCICMCVCGCALVWECLQMCLPCSHFRIRSFFHFSREPFPLTFCLRLQRAA